ncbi:MAG: hydrogenase 4 subunit B [Dehalococcoidia bacterium]|nr:hydrogenase 4 subunit B [Dehalococcoidia bacterium]
MELLTALALALAFAASVIELTGVSRGTRAGYWLTACAAAVALGVFSWLIADGATVEFDLWSPAPSIDLQWRMDQLGAFFGGVVAVVALFASVFAVRYSHPRRLDDAIYPIFVLSMVGVAGAGNVFTFFVMWELMALTSFLLVLSDGQGHSRRMAALLYVGMTHVATVLAVASLLLLANSAGTQEFRGMTLAEPDPNARAALALVLALVGFGTKAGLMPLHIWLPRAHPVAPSHVSALMSAAMVNTGIYGIIRVGFDFLGPGETWWGILLMAVGATTAVLGVLYALMERDVKRCLAYSTVENVGIITLALGVALAFRASGADELAAAALIAALVHTFNHALLKSLLFLGAGAIQHAASSLDMDRLGGLLPAMPWTGAAMLIGAVGLASVPPLNGFVGEWMLARSLVSLASHGPSVATRLAASGGLAMLALTAGLALACFVRLFGMVFLGVARGDTVPRRDAPVLMTLPLLGLAAASVGAAVAAPGLVWLFRGVVETLLPSGGARVEDVHRIGLGGGGSFSPAVAAIALLVFAPLPWLVLRLVFGRTQRQRGPVWATASAFAPSMQYTATSLSKPLRLFFRRVLGPQREIKVEFHGSSPLPRRVSYSGQVPAVIEERLYLPLRSLAIWSAQRIRAFQNGSVELYLLYVFAALLALLVVAR